MKQEVKARLKNYLTVTEENTKLIYAALLAGGKELIITKLKDIEKHARIMREAIERDS